GHLTSGAVEAGRLASERVRCIRLDGWVQQSRLQGVGLVKIDVEGHELAVLEGGAEFFKKQRPDLIIEFNLPTLRSSSSDAAERLLERLYSLYPQVFIISEHGPLVPVHGLRLAQLIEQMRFGRGVEDLFCTGKDQLPQPKYSLTERAFLKLRKWKRRYL